MIKQIKNNLKKIITIKRGQYVSTPNFIKQTLLDIKIQTPTQYFRNGISSIFNSVSVQYIFFSAVYGTVFKVGHILVLKSSLNKYEKIEITICILSEHNGIKLEGNTKRNYTKYFNTWRVNNTLLNDQ
jgi:hypothetical protein